jgi:hypothetical protein
MFTPLQIKTKDLLNLMSQLQYNLSGIESELGLPKVTLTRIKTGKLKATPEQSNMIIDLYLKLVDYQVNYAKKLRPEISNLSLEAIPTDIQPATQTEFHTVATPMPLEAPISTIGTMHRGKEYSVVPVEDTGDKWIMAIPETPPNFQNVLDSQIRPDELPEIQFSGFPEKIANEVPEIIPIGTSTIHGNDLQRYSGKKNLNILEGTYMKKQIQGTNLAYYLQYGGSTYNSESGLITIGDIKYQLSGNFGSINKCMI